MGTGAQVQDSRRTSFSSTLLDTSRLMLRQFVPSDLDHFARICSDPEVMAHQRAPLEKVAASRLLDDIIDHYGAHTFGLWALIHKADKRLIGFCGLTLQEVDSEDEITLEYRILPPYWGRGLATEAAREVLAYAQRELGMSRVISLIDKDNARAIRVSEKLGGLFERSAISNGVHCLLYVYPVPTKS